MGDSGLVNNPTSLDEFISNIKPDTDDYKHKFLF